MEVDSSAIDERKEGGSAALLQVDEQTDGSPSDFPSQSNDGAPRVCAGPKQRVDSADKPACELCGRRLSKVKHHRAHGPGRACHPQCKSLKRRIEGDVAVQPTAVRSHKRARSDPGPSSSLVISLPLPRTKRPYESLRPTQKRERRKQLRSAIAEAEQETGCPVEALHLQQRTTPEELLHLTTAERERIRTVPSLHIPSEQTMIACKKQLATSHATATGTFAGGAYITDPLRFVSVLCAQSSFIAVGGDAGGGRCALGVTYSIPTPTAANPEETTQHFACLLVYEGGDSWLELQDCRAEGLTPFVGDSAAFPHIFAVLQHLIDTRAAFLNGDWPFINGLLGLMSPSATHPCPICIITHNSFTKTARYRTAADKHSVDRTHSPLLTISSDRIVPTPLHLFLGISNRIILNVLSELLGKEHVEETLKKVTTIHSAGCGGLSDLHDLNGPEIRKWIKRDCSTALRTAVETKSSLTAAQKATHSVLKSWLEKLHKYLLVKKEWKAEEIEDWRAAVDDIQQHWCAETSQAAFPKLHMLRHSLEFAERHHFLGRASESQIESFHASFNALFHKQHRNQSSNTSERLRRSLADAALRAVQPFATQ